MDILSKWYVKLLLAGVILFFLGKALYSNFSAVQEYDWSINWKNVVFSTLLVLVNFVYFSWILKIFVKYFSGKNIPLATVYRIFAIAGLGKYIPGKIWALTGMVVLFQREGVDRADGIIATITYQYIYIAAGLMLTVCGGMVYFREWLTPLLLVIGIPIMLLMIYPPILSSFMNFALRKFGINQECRRLKFRTGLYFMFLFLISWVVYGIAFYIFINGIIELPLSSLFILMVIFACAYVIGFVSFFVPGGLGVREGIMSASLVTLIPSSIAIIVALLSRVWMSGAEIIMYMSLLVVKSKSNSGV